MRVPSTHHSRGVAAALLLLSAAGASARAQLPHASAAALGTGGNATASSRGFGAIASNPANLALPDGPGLSATVLPIGGSLGVSPVPIAELSRYGGRVVPDDVKSLWLDNVSAAGTQRGTGAADVTYIAATMHSVGVQYSTSLRSAAVLSPALTELLLFGNAGRTGQPRDLSFDGSSFVTTITSTFAVGYGVALVRRPERTLSVGATAKYTIGHYRSEARDVAGMATASPLAVRLSMPVLQTGNAQNPGQGVGLDLGAAWSSRAWSAGLVVKNVVSTFAWNPARFYYRPMQMRFDATVQSASADSLPFASAPAALRDRIAGRAFPPELAAGAAWQAAHRLRLTTDVGARLGGGDGLEPAAHAGTGMELRALSFLTLRASASALSGGWQYAAGLGLEGGPLNVNVAAGRRRDALGASPLGMLTVSLGGR